MLVPRSLGGLELEPATMLATLETVGAADASVGWCVMIGATTAVVAAYLPPDVAREIYAAPGTITGGVFAPLGRAVVDGDHYRLSGRWQWASGSANCHWLMGGSVILDDGTPRRLPNGAPDARLLLFPAARATLIDTWHVSGLCGTGSGDMAVEGLRVPLAHSVSLMVDAPREAGALYRFPVFGLLALGIAAVMLGNAGAAVADLVELAGGKQPQGSRKVLAERAVAQSELAQAAAALRAARALFYETVESAWAAACAGGPLDVATRAGLRLAATHATRTAADVARVMYDLGGGSAVFARSPLQRRFRDAHVGTQHLMVSPATWELTGRVLMGLPTDPTQL
jgi:alkylation response protein AidB-like acyl-CoA dehydrogenase